MLRFKTRELAVEELLRVYREVSIAKGARWIKKLSSIYWASRKFLNGSSSCQEAIENATKAIENAIKRSWKSLIDSLAIERCPAAVEIAQKQFFKKRKTHTWMQSSMLYNQRSKQHFKLSKSSFNKKNVKHIDPKHTHTHTLNKSNQFYISKTS